MTRKEAAKVLLDCKEKSFRHSFYTLEEYHSALDMAIEALKEPVLQSDGTLTVNSEYYDKTKRVLLENGTSGTLFYPDESEQNPCEDAISREAVMNCLKASKLKKFDWTIDAREKIKALPSVTPIRHKGKWIAYKVELPDGYVLNYTCSVCGRKLVGYSTETLKDAPYCHCGAEMKEDNDADRD